MRNKRKTKMDQEEPLDPRIQVNCETGNMEKPPSCAIKLLRCELIGDAQSKTDKNKTKM